MNTGRFAGKIAIVTGGGSGIGRAVSEQLLQQGAVVVVGQRSASSVGDFFKTDLAEPDQCEALVNYTVERHGRLDILINNAGIMTESRVDELTLADWNRHLAVNLTAPFILTKVAIPALGSTRGTIVNVGSIEGLGANPGHAAYCASKGGLHALTRATAVDTGPLGIRCNAVAPGWIDTELNQDFISAMPNPELFRQRVATLHPAGRTGNPEDVANLVCWLASEEAAFVTGQIYTVDGGRTAQLSLPG